MPLVQLPSWRRVLASCVAAVLVGSTALTSCSSKSDDPPEPGASDAQGERPDALRPRVRPPSRATTVVTGRGAAELAVATSAALYDRAPVVVLAGERDRSGQARAASVAVGLGAPLLVAPRSATTRTAQHVADELERLAPRAVLSVGDGAERWGRERDLPLVAAPADARELARLTGDRVGEPEAVGAADVLASVTELRREQPPLLTVEPPNADQPNRGRSDGADGDGAGNDGAQSDDGGGDGDGGERADQGEDGDGDEAAGDGSAEGGAGENGESGESEGGGGDGDGELPELPEVAPADPLESVLVLAADPATDVAAAATARASGARVSVVADADPRTNPRLIAAVADRPAEQVVALGEAFGSAERLRYRLDVAETGVELPGGGQVVFPGRRMAALYGHPGTPAMGVLGEQPVAASIRRAQQLAADYEPLVDEPVVPAFEIIATVASQAPGPDGDYSDESTVEDLRPWIDAAGEAGVYVMLDLQPGRTDFLTQARRYEELLAEPHVGLALDPEWRLGPNERHLEQIGSVDVAEINRVATWLADLTRARRLPQKLLLVHQFRTAMISDRASMETGRDELSVLIHADGFGTPGQKFATWNALQANPPPDITWGWKNFIDEDQPTFSPAQTVAIEPSPLFVSYQ